MLEMFKVNYLNRNKGCKVIINPDGLGADNGGKPMSTGRFWHPIFTLDNGDRKAKNGLTYLKHTYFLDPNMNHTSKNFFYISFEAKLKT